MEVTMRALRLGDSDSEAGEAVSGVVRVRVRATIRPVGF